MRILAIDPGYERMGIAVLEKTPQVKKEVLLYSDCFKTSSKLPHFERLRLIGEEIERLITQFKPQALAIETLFFAANKKTAMNVSEARGVMLYTASKNGLHIYEHMPNEIKVAVTGYGKSGKQEIMKIIPLLIPLSKPIEHDDEYDAIAVGLTCLAHIRIPTSTGKL